MKVVIVACLVILLCVQRVFSNSTVTDSENFCETLYLLNVVPYPDNSTFAGWDRGFELIPAGHLATRHINSDPNVLQGYKLEVIDVASEACGRSLVTEGLIDYYIESLGQTRRCVVGLYCSTVTNTIASIANHPNMGYVQLAASTSPLHRNIRAFPHTFHSISSSRIFNNAMIALMDRFNWKRVNVVFDSLGFYFRSTAADFVELIKLDANKTLTSKTPIQPLLSSIINAFDVINSEEARIGYFSVSEGEIATFFCEAYKRQFLWPGYVYILQERSLEQIHQTPVDCSREEMIEALEGTFLLQYRLFGDQEANLVSGLTYKQYHDQYIEDLEKFERRTGMRLEDNTYANTLYDQVWAFALAANISLQLETVQFINSSTSRNNVEHAINARDNLVEKLNQVEFDGVSGFVKFGAGKEVLTSVEIYQVRSGLEVLIGEYNAYNQSVNFLSNFDPSIIPEDTFEVLHQLVPKWVGIISILIDIALILLILFSTIFTVYWKDKPEIKSGSYSLSLIILVGCYMLCISPIFNTVTAIFVISREVFTVFCNIQLWSFICGNFLIFVTLLMRLFRVFHVFRSFHATGKYWSDGYLILYIIVTVCSIVILLVIWTAVDAYRYVEERNYIPTGTPPFYLVHAYCSSNSLGVWLAIFLSLIGLVMALLVFLAIQTRHIKHKHFKDTKKVNMFIFSVCTVNAIFLPLWVLLSAIEIETGAFVCLMTANLAGPAMCQAFLFLPKIIPAFNSKTKTLKNTTSNTIILQRYTQRTKK